MTLFNRFKGVALVLLGFCLSLIGVRAAEATTRLLEVEAIAADQPMIAQSGPVCTYEWQEVQFYARIATEEDPLRVRSTPGGQVIGAIPKGWAVVVVDLDETGDWTKVTSHFGDVFGDVYSGGFATAPDFRTGWVATRYLENLGEFCEKPMNLTLQPLSHTAIAAAPSQEDWLELGDRIARTQQ